MRYYSTVWLKIGNCELKCNVQYECSTPATIDLFHIDVSEILIWHWVSVHDSLYPCLCYQTMDHLWLRDRGWDVVANKIAWRAIEKEIWSDTEIYRKLIEKIK